MRALSKHHSWKEMYMGRFNLIFCKIRNPGKFEIYASFSLINRFIFWFLYNFFKSNILFFIFIKNWYFLFSYCFFGFFLFTLVSLFFSSSLNLFFFFSMPIIKLTFTDISYNRFSIVPFLITTKIRLNTLVIRYAKCHKSKQY